MMEKTLVGACHCSLRARPLKSSEALLIPFVHSSKPLRRRHVEVAMLEHNVLEKTSFKCKLVNPQAESTKNGFSFEGTRLEEQNVTILLIIEYDSPVYKVAMDAYEATCMVYPSWIVVFKDSLIAQSAQSVAWTAWK
ncbi:hypothetical protein GOP47_0025916 [Adiantum capillus-veneris]|uniref:Uncharacterized protein n=1 Tax=Adiantum capillus-veneris TaxID=13818 RepID=A0A9D4U1H9_ADICA|nr:hypothetical protein GOP47_0025916 [Adiantum capillus-veneris]